MSEVALDTFTITRRAIDPRADGACRVVQLTATTVIIDRVLDGVRMRIGVPMSAYRDLVICVRMPAARAMLKLRHQDSDLDVVIGSGPAVDVAKSARAWSAVIGKPVAVEDACVAIGTGFARLRKRIKASRRSAFARRRRLGDTQRLATRFAGEPEIIARN